MKWTTHLFVILLTKFKAYMYCYHIYSKHWNCASQPSGTSTISRSIKVQILRWCLFTARTRFFQSALTKRRDPSWKQRGSIRRMPSMQVLGSEPGAGHIYYDNACTLVEPMLSRCTQYRYSRSVEIVESLGTHMRSNTVCQTGGSDTQVEGRGNSPSLQFVGMMISKSAPPSAIDLGNV